MLRLVLLLIYLLAPSSTPQEKQGGSLDPLGFTPPLQGGETVPAPPQNDQGGGIDPLG
jgi:hypothetical protein